MFLWFSKVVIKLILKGYEELMAREKIIPKRISVIKFFLKR